MVSSTNSVSTQGSRTFLSGGASKIDTAALIDAAYKQRIAEADKIDIRVQRNVSKQTSFNELQTLSRNLQTSLTSLRKSYGAVTSETSRFALKAGTLSTAASGVDVNNLVSVSISNSAVASDNTIRVTRLAKEQIVQGAAYADPSVALGQTGGFSIGLSGGVTANISVTAGMSLNDLAATINAQSGTTKVAASVELIAPGQSRLVLRGLETNKEIITAPISGTDVLQSVGVKNASNAFVNVVQPFESAQVTVNNITYTRDSNKITDILPGVELNLKNISTADIRLQIGNDTSAVKDAILDFVENYNLLRDFVIEQSTVASDGTVSEDAVLYKDTILSSLNQTIQSLMGRSYGLGGTNLSSLREMGLTLDKTNRLVADEVKLDDVISNKFDQLRSVFETRFTSTNSQFTILSNTSSVNAANIVFDITHDGTNVTGVSANGDNTLFDISGGSITGKVGSIYEGLRFAYVGTTNATLTFDMTQGFADLSANALDKFTNSVSGIIKSQTEALDRENTNFNARADRVRERAEDFRDRLIERYGRFEALINRNETVLAQIRAILNVNRNNN
jgi:flagellar hook-associated protein 2